ncbi:HAD hydrolase-like protein [Paraburkholderia aromaticivorans]|uniref:HAD hydrolase-like protein n=1 Tax=Paraburkholderia aromaticivorans TaxID=2026199 RepID=UPI0014560511|nr:HAD hydrolase-like protein [Paraburkholderia aromaticivorans]
MTKAAVFDVDGTLVDSGDLHASAWQEAFTRFGREVTIEQARSHIGKGGDQLLPVILTATQQQAFDIREGASFHDAPAGWHECRMNRATRPFVGWFAQVLAMRSCGCQLLGLTAGTGAVVYLFWRQQAQVMLDIGWQCLPCAAISPCICQSLRSESRAPTYGCDAIS